MYIDVLNVHPFDPCWVTWAPLCFLYNVSTLRSSIAQPNYDHGDNNERGHVCVGYQSYH